MSILQKALDGPGPRTKKDALTLFLKGFCMGAADIIPGVSGGTMAFITGIYQDLITAINSFDMQFFQRLFRLDLGGALSRAHLRFLLPLLLGIGLAIVSSARIINHLMTAYPVEVWSLFFGLIAASIVVVARRVETPSPGLLVWVALGAAAGYLIVGLIPVQTPEALWFIFLAGMVAICAMILPGISGAFILLILGKYEYMTSALKNPFAGSNLMVIIVFLCGAVVGILAFAKLLRFLFQRFPDATVATLAGFMLGALRKVWPWKEVLETRETAGKILVLAEKNVAPPALDGAFVMALGMMLLGLVLVLLLDRISRAREMAVPEPPEPRGR